jgi:haloacetate dehalogenase
MIAAHGQLIGCASTIPKAVRKVCFMDIAPTLRMYRDTSKEFATKYMWWFFLIQKAPLPEHMIGADAAFFLEQHFELQCGTSGALKTRR